MSDLIVLRNRVPEARVNLQLLRRVVRALIHDLLCQPVQELGVYIVTAEEMTRLNETFVRHQGVTDVITFNYSEALEQIPHSKSCRATGAPEPRRPPIDAEIFVCRDEARVQARRFQTNWQNELVRYIVHGLLHLVGYDDHAKPDRLRMKRRENQLLRQLAQRFPLEKLGRFGV